MKIIKVFRDAAHPHPEPALLRSVKSLHVIQLPAHLTNLRVWTAFWKARCVFLTHKAGGTLDLVLSLKNSADSISISDLQIEPNTGTDSDHYLITFKVPLMKKSPEPPEIRQIRELHKIDVDKFKEDLFCSSLAVIGRPFTNPGK